MVFVLSRRFLMAWLALVAGAMLVSTSTFAKEPDASQRAAFKQAYLVAQQGGNDWQTLASKLHDYPLYPYLQAAALEHDIRQADVASVTAYIDRYPGWIPAADLRHAFLLELARRQDWNHFLALYQPGLGDALQCDALQARGSKLDFERDLAELWAKPNLPNACTPVLDAAHQQGLLTDARLWTRIDRAADAGQAGTIAGLADWLPLADRDSAQQLVLALRDPAAAVSKAAHWPDTSRRRQAATLALTRLARRQSVSADAAWQILRHHFHFSTEQRDQILYALALFHATDFDDHALARLIALPAAVQTDSTREWRVRVALARQNWTAVLAAIDAMPAVQQQDGEWQYFRGRALDALGRHDDAHRQFVAEADKATFFGFLAADKVNQPYAICPLTVATDAPREQSLLANAGLMRAFELYAVDLPKLARREWADALHNADATTRQVASEMANRRGWYDRAVFALNSGDGLRMYSLRFPLVRQDGMVAQAKQAGIDPSWAYAILRAESAWMTDAHSGADARGLMQLLPSTGALVAKHNGLAWAGGDSLYDPAVNITLGTLYLAHLSNRFNGSPWLASAAYNAGPNRIDEWLAARGTLTPDLFIATIPFKETREYVARVMAFSVIYDWRLHGTAVPLDTRLNLIGQPYERPDASTPRRDVGCLEAAPKAAMSSAVATP